MSKITTTNQTTPDASSQIDPVQPVGKEDAFRPVDGDTVATENIGANTNLGPTEGTLPTADEINKLTEQLERTFVRTEAERREAEALANDMEARRIRELPRPTIYCRPVLHPATDALLGYEYVDGLGNRVEKPADFE